MDFRKLFEKKPTAGKPESVEDADLRNGGPAVGCSGARRFLGALVRPLPSRGRSPGRARPRVSWSPEDPEAQCGREPGNCGRDSGIRSIPTMILFKNGRPVDTIVGAMPMNPLRARLDKHAGADKPAETGR